VLRGGSWLDAPGFARSARRACGRPAFRIVAHGFRVASTP